MSEPEQTPIRRRTLLAGATAAAVAGTLGGLERPAVAAAAPLGALPPPQRSGIDHIIVVMMENRSFDHFFGWVPGAEGKQAGLTYQDTAGTSHRTHHLRTFQGCAHPDPDHSYPGGRIQYDDGACDGFLRSGHNDSFAIGYYLADDLAFYGSAARYWTVFDHYFAPTMGPTYPNRLYQHSAKTDRRDDGKQTCTLPTIWDRLDQAGVSGGYYYSDVPFLALYGSVYQSISHPVADFLDDCASGSLPSVSFVDPKFTGEGTGTSADDHPHADIRAGQYFLNEIYAAVTASPVWPRTALIINYDEWGGFFDHVPPTTAPDEHPQYALRGFRVPALMISPRARRQYVGHHVYDHTSVLKLIEWRHGLAPLSARDAAARNIGEVLDFRSAPNNEAPQWHVPKVTGQACPPGSLTSGYEDWEQIAGIASAAGWRVGG
jgi:phospholipase C